MFWTSTPSTRSPDSWGDIVLGLWGHPDAIGRAYTTMERAGERVVSCCAQEMAWADEMTLGFIGLVVDHGKADEHRMY